MRLLIADDVGIGKTIEAGLIARELAWRREGFQDLWQGLWVTFLLFDENWRGEVLGLSPLNGDLFGLGTLSALDNCAIDNYDLLAAIRQLSLYQDKGQLRRVNYEYLDVEELGSVYESLLDFHPEIIRNSESGSAATRCNLRLKAKFSEGLNYAQNFSFRIICTPLAGAKVTPRR